MGEIGISRREFLYEVRFWEVARIIRGYRRRGRLRDQLIAHASYAALYALRDPGGKTVQDLFPMLFDDEERVPISEEDRAELNSLMQAYSF